MWSGVTVQTRMRRALPVDTRVAKATLAASTAMSEVAISGGAICLLDPGSLDDPLIVRLHHLGEIVIGEQIGRGITTNAGYLALRKYPSQRARPDV